MPRANAILRNYQVENIVLTILSLVLQARSLELDRDSTLTLDIHVIEILLLHVARLDQSGLFYQAVSKGRFTVVYVGYYAEISNIVQITHFSLFLLEHYPFNYKENTALFRGVPIIWA